jgi:ribosomal protein S18 acetylase RimI-like enzyme
VSGTQNELPGHRLLPMTWRDFRSVYSLERTCFLKDAWPWFDVLASLTFPETVRIKAVVDAEMIGFVIGDRRRGQDLGWIASLAVHPDFRRRGFGRILLRACEEELQMSQLRLTLRPSNKGAEKLYLEEGYSRSDLWKRYYNDGEDGLVMEKIHH